MKTQVDGDLPVPYGLIVVEMSALQKSDLITGSPDEDPIKKRETRASAKKPTEHQSTKGKVPPTRVRSENSTERHMTKGKVRRIGEYTIEHTNYAYCLVCKIGFHRVPMKGRHEKICNLHVACIVFVKVEWKAYGAEAESLCGVKVGLFLLSRIGGNLNI